MRNSGNRTMEMRYYAEYMHWHRLALKGRGEELFTRITIRLNQITSDYGRNWIRALGMTFGVGWIFYMIHYVTLPGCNFGSQYFNSSNIGFHIGHFLEFLLPIHKPDFMGVQGDFSLAVDVLSRIFIGFMLYQLITAFRRFGQR